MKVVRIFLLIICALVSAGSAQSRIADWVENFFGMARPDLGTWFCSGCGIMAPGDQGYNTALFGEVATFIRTNNEEIFEGKVAQWKLGQSITICDGINCMKFFFEFRGGLTRWVPHTAARPQLPTDRPKVPTNPSPQTSVPVVPGQEAVEIRQIMPDLISITVPYIAPRPLVPSVTVEYIGGSTISVGPAAAMPNEMQSDIGAYLQWEPAWTPGLEPDFGGSCRASIDPTNCN